MLPPNDETSEERWPAGAVAGGLAPQKYEPCSSGKDSTALSANIGPPTPTLPLPRPPTAEGGLHRPELPGVERESVVVRPVP